ncbi:MAG: TM2 domain-containing protein [Actinomyces ruminicola]|uniref:TM2 domain-containing protein n=1 Tax=Actinomyces ruminicola TaxID=332524 RepID=A0A1G9RX17_9ACTO|nr:TM2 domain-containing protein [Actinomyces ruminicola]MBE6482282.1 TM2 domain-containing protein [Actinomyces ruminicola]SDM27722.1 TM2 domain-containing protein [Actinomyces ruminicola]
MTTSPFSAPEPQNADGSYGAGASGADYPQGYQGSTTSPGAAAANPYQQLDTYQGAQAYAGGAYPPGYEQAQQAGYQQQGYQNGGYQQAYQDPAYQSGYQQPGYQAPAAAYGQPYAVYNQKSKVAAGLLGIFLGSLGVHNFYLGHTGKAVAQLLITLLSLGFLAFVSAIWGLVEGIIILTATPGAQPWGVDAKGVPLSS